MPKKSPDSIFLRFIQLSVFKRKSCLSTFKKGTDLGVRKVPLCTDLGVRPNHANILFLNNKILKPSHLWGTDLGVKQLLMCTDLGVKRDKFGSWPPVTAHN